MMKTKELFMQIREEIESMAQMCFDGDLNPIEVARELYHFRKEVEPFEKQILESAFNESEKYSKDELSEMKIQYSGGGYTYSYDHIPEWNEINEKKKIIEENAKNAFLQSLKDYDSMIVSGDGEVVTPAIAKSRKQSIIFKR